ncbi:toprim domain-containing protein, partial [Elusimicrobiota bacterium]
ALSPLDGIGPEDLTIGKLLQRLDNSEIKEVVIATDPNVEGEATAEYIKEILNGYPVRVTRLAYGIPIGGNLEYADGATLGRAIEGRREF